MKLLAITAVAISLATPSFADTVGNAQRLLEMWGPTKITLSGGTLTVVLPQRRITSQIYLAVINTGICFSPLRGIDLQGVEQVEILNQFSAQGYVYEKGTEDCDTLNHLPSNGSSIEIQIMENTHQY